MAAPSGFIPDDLTARARIRQAAMEQFAEHGYPRTTIRSIAAAAGVSPGLLRHHFGSKEELRDAVDAHVVGEIRKANEAVLEGSRRGDLSPASLSRPDLKPYQAYVVRALVDGSPTMAGIFDEVVDLTVGWVHFADQARSDGPPTVDARARAGVLAGMAFGVQLLAAHVSRSLGVSTATPAGERLLNLALIEIYSHALISPELAATARASIDGPQHPTTAPRSEA